MRVTGFYPQPPRLNLLCDQCCNTILSRLDYLHIGLLKAATIRMVKIAIHFSHKIIFTICTCISYEATYMYLFTKGLKLQKLDINLQMLQALQGIRWLQRQAKLI